MAKKTNKMWRNSKKLSRNSNSASAQTVEKILRVTKLGRHYDGIAMEEEDGKPTCQFVPYTLPGELVRVKSDGKRAEAIEVLEPSDDRIEPFCPHFTKCGGCAAQHLATNPYRAWKRSIVETTLRNKGHKVVVDELIDAHGDGRRRVTFHVQFENNKIQVGFMQARSHALININACPILTSELTKSPKVVNALAEPFQKEARPLDIAITSTPQGMDCDIRGVGKFEYYTHIAIAEIAKKYDLARVSIDGILSLELRKPIMAIGTAKVPLPSACFLQATAAGEETIAQLVLAELSKSKNVADLFCGIGPFALRLASTKAVYAADASETAIAALNYAVRFTKNLKQVETAVRDLFHNPMYHGDLNRFDSIIINPARAGAEAQVEEISISEVPLVIYVSCNPTSLARDAEILVDGGYTFGRAMPVDQFKFSPHVETVAIFRQS
jgi:23S rRNA (uracil1939-C5)-methyltransferase